MDTRSDTKKEKHVAITFLLISLYAFFILPLSPLLAQTSTKVDRLPPVIQHRPFLATLDVEDPVIFRATVTDNQALHKVHIFYRITGEKRFTKIKMEQVGQKEYLTIVPQRFVLREGIEYYIQASDTAGNIATQGFPNAPLRIRFKAPLKGNLPQIGKIKTPLLPPQKSGFRLSTTSGTTGQIIGTKKPWYKKWWVWSIALGVVAGVAAASGGGGGNSPTPTANTGTGNVSAGIP